MKKTPLHVLHQCLNLAHILNGDKRKRRCVCTALTLYYACACLALHVAACEQGALLEIHLDAQRSGAIRPWLAARVQAQGQGATSCLLEAKQGHVASAACLLPLHVSAAASVAGPWRVGKPSPRPRQPQVSAARPARQLRRLMRQLCSLHVHMHHTFASGGSSLVRRFPYMLSLFLLCFYTQTQRQEATAITGICT